MLTLEICDIPNYSTCLQAKLRSELIQPFWQAVQSAQATGSSKQHGLLQPLQVC